MPCRILCAAGGILLVVYIVEKIKARSLKAVLIKSVVSVLFLAVGATAWYLSARGGSLSVTGVFVLLGLLCGLLGDIWLDLKYVFPDRDDAFTYAGMAAFSVGHVLYLIGLLAKFAPAGKPLYVILPFVLAAGASGFNLLLEKPMKLHYGKMKPVVFVYGVLLFSALAMSGSLAMSRGFGETTLNLFFAGTILFAVSDVILSGTYWGQGKDRPIDLALNYLTYYPAQYLIAVSLLYLK